MDVNTFSETAIFKVVIKERSKKQSYDFTTIRSGSDYQTSPVELNIDCFYGQVYVTTVKDLHFFFF